MKRILLLIITLILTDSISIGNERVSLPDIGSSAEAAIGPEEERRMGESLLYEYHRYELVIEDPELNEYLSSLGYRLVAQSERPDLDFQFFMVKQNSINAFAAPGGFIGVHTGLLTTAENESEVAAVLAHEVAHVTQHHLIRTVEDMKKVSLPIALAMIGAVIAAQQSGTSSDAAPAAIMAGMGALQQNILNFTREHEYEADRVGIKTLAQASFDPTAMATFFARMDRVMRPNGDRPPEFLSTHPVSAARISEAKSRAAQIKPVEIQSDSIKNIHLANIKVINPDKNSTFVAPKEFDSKTNSTALRNAQRESFLRIRERARVLSAVNVENLVGFYREQLDKGIAPSDSAYRYGLSLALARSGKFDESIKILQTLKTKTPNELSYTLALADTLTRAGQLPQARQTLEQVYANHAGHRAVALTYADALLASQDKKDAQRALGVLRPVLSQVGWDVALQRSFARASELSGDTTRALEAHAEVSLYTGNAEDALRQLQSLLDNKSIGYYQRARVENRIAEIMPLVIDLRKRFGDANVGDRF